MIGKSLFTINLSKLDAIINLKMYEDITTNTFVL